MEKKEPFTVKYLVTYQYNQDVQLDISNDIENLLASNTECRDLVDATLIYINIMISKFKLYDNLINESCVTLAWDFYVEILPQVYTHQYGEDYDEEEAEGEFVFDMLASFVASNKCKLNEFEIKLFILRFLFLIENSIKSSSYDQQNAAIPEFDLNEFKNIYSQKITSIYNQGYKG